MRSTLLTRAVITAATLAIGSAAFAAVPASAASPSGITREAVLSLAAAARADAVDPAAANDVLTKECGLETGETFGVLPARVTAVDPNSVVDGVIVTRGVALLGLLPTSQCIVSLVAPKAAGTVLSGTGNLSVTTSIPVLGTTPQETTLSGDVASTVIPDAGVVDVLLPGATYTVTGAATSTTTVTDSVKVSTPKTKAQKKAAKKKYTKRLASAKKKYAKAKKKAHSSKSKKAAAKRSYAKSRAKAKAAYKKSIAGYTVVQRTRPVTQSRPFSVAAQQPFIG